MNELLPIIALLADAKTHVERAEWLRSCPIVILRRYDMTIRNRLMLAGFSQGLSYLEDLQAALSRTRDGATGVFGDEAIDILARSGLWLQAEAERLDAARLASAPDHSITEL